MKRVILSTLFIIAAVILVVVSCKKDKTEDNTVIYPNSNNNNTTVVMGTITGKVIANNEITPVPMVMVFVDDNGEIYLTHTAIDGTFTLSAPAGLQNVYIESGYGRVFRTVVEVTVPENGSVTLPGNGDVKLEQVANLAYIKGMYDNIQTIIIDSLGYAADEITINDLDNLTTLENYGGIFLNCGKTAVLDSLKYHNLEQYVINGGSLYASDYAVEYLTGDGHYKGVHSHGIMEGKSTCTADLGGFINDTLLCTKKIGPASIIHSANIVPTDLQTYMGVAQIDVEYNLSAWEVIQDVYLPPWEVLVEDPNTYGPLAIRMTFPSSTKGLKNMLEDGWVTICHIPPGNPENAHTITISVNALQAHLNHGDYLGACVGEGEGNTTGGVIYYTTFHNHVQGHVSSDMQKMLEYFILNL